MSYRRSTVRGLVVTRLAWRAWTVHEAQTSGGWLPAVRRFRSRRAAVAWICEVYA